MVEHRDTSVPVRRGKFQIRVVEGGEGDNLLYLHGEDGFPGWTPFLDRLAQHYHVYAPAHPGVAGSQGLEYLDGLWDLVLLYDELAQELGLDRLGAIGHSYGGMLAAELAAHRADRISRLVLMNSLGLWLDETPIPDFFIFTPEERAQSLWHDPESEVAKAALTPPEDPEERMEEELSRMAALAAVGKFVWPIPDRGLAKRALRITAPTLLLWGDSDDMVPLEYAQEFQRLLPSATLKVISRCGHFPQEERPREALEAVLDFLGR